MAITLAPDLTSSGQALDTSAACFGELRSSAALLGNVTALRERLREDGYLCLPGYLDRQLVLEARQVITGRLAAEGYLMPGTPSIEAIARPECELRFRPDLAEDNKPLDQLLYSG